MGTTFQFSQNGGGGGRLTVLSSWIYQVTSLGVHYSSIHGSLERASRILYMVNLACVLSVIFPRSLPRCSWGCIVVVRCVLANLPDAELDLLGKDKE